MWLAQKRISQTDRPGTSHGQSSFKLANSDQLINQCISIFYPFGLSHRGHHSESPFAVHWLVQPHWLGSFGNLWGSVSCLETLQHTATNASCAIWHLPLVSILILVSSSVEDEKLWITPCVAVASNFSSPGLHSRDWSKSYWKHTCTPSHLLTHCK